MSDERRPPTPPQVAPVKRPAVVAPHAGLDLEHGSIERLVQLRMELMHGANHNDPTAWALPSYGDRSVRR